jgi:two-component system, response regulator / RNA-binding antiterminator
MSLRVLLIDARCGEASRLEAVLSMSGFSVVGSLQEADDVLAAVSRLEPDAIIIDADSPRRDTLEGLALLGQHKPRPIVMLSEQGDSTLVRVAAEAGVSAYVVDGISPQSVRSLVEVAVLHFHGSSLLRAELDRTQQVMEERHLIDRAKCFLMEQKGWSERDSYHQLRRLAMSRGQKMSDVARQLLGAFETV